MSAAPDCSAPSAIRVRRVAQTYGGSKGVDIDSLDIAAGRITAIVGASGCGKSTLMHLISGMCPLEADATEAEIVLAVRKAGTLCQIDALREGWREIRREIGFIFQEDYLIRSGSGQQNLLLSLATAGKTLDRTGLETMWAGLELESDSLDSRAMDYSGGMKQRAAVARALVREPSIIFADEPTANLDPQKARQVMRLLVEWADAAPHRTLILVTHDLDLVDRFAEDVVVMSKPSQDAPGGLAEGAVFPMLNPHDRGTLESLMYGHPIPTTSCHAQGDENEAAPHGQDAVSGAPAREGTRKATSDVVYRGIFGIGHAIVTEPPQPVSARSTVAQQVYGITRLAVLWVMRILGALALLTLLGQSGWLPTDLVTWLGAQGLPQLARGAVSATKVWGFGLLAMFFLFSVMMHFAGRLKNSVVADAAVFTILLAAAVILGTADRYANAAFEEEMSDPSLQPILVENGAEPLTDARLDEVETSLDGLRPVGTVPAGIDTQAVFGRYHKLGSLVYLPRRGSNPPDCAESRSDLITMNLLAPDPEEPLGRGLRYQPLIPGKMPDPDLPKVHEDETLGALDFKVAQDTGAVGSVFDALEPEAAQPEIVLTLSSYGLLAELDRSTPPAALCMDIARTRFNLTDDRVFAIKGLVDRIPKFDVRQYDGLVALDVGAILTSRDMSAHGPDDEYSLAALWVDRDYRAATIAEIEHLEAEGWFKTLPGFEALRRALLAADQSAATRRYLMIFVAAIGMFVTVRIVAGIMRGLNRELAVARAFGARAPHLIVLLIAAMWRPALLALVVVAATAILVADTLVGWAFALVPETLEGARPWLGALGWTAAVFTGIWTGAIVSYVLVMVSFTPSIARQMQDSE